MKYMVLCGKDQTRVSGDRQDEKDAHGNRCAEKFGYASTGWFVERITRGLAAPQGFEPR